MRTSLKHTAHGVATTTLRRSSGEPFFFTARLRRRTADAPTDQAPWKSSAPRILVVDDNATSRSVLAGHLADWGAAAKTAASGPEALEALKAASQVGNPFELAVLDYEMPEMDGLETLHAIRSDPGLATLRIILVVPLGCRLDRTTVAKAGIASQLTKPVRRSLLRGALATALGEELAANKPDAPEAHASEAAGERRSIEVSILLVEDNSVNQMVAGKLLAKLGCRVEVAVNGREALDKTADTEFDAILMDCQMPVMDGFEATRAIRERETADRRARRSPIVALTANAMAEDRERCLAAGMDDFLSKPFTSDGLKAVIERWVRTGREVAIPPSPR